MTRRVRHLLDGGFKLRHLQIVTAVADNGTIVGAARELHVTQPVVTRAVREAEAILGVPLFDRGPRGVAPTVFGGLVIDHARAVLANLNLIDEGIHELRSGGLRPVRVGANRTASHSLVPKALISVKKALPRLKITVIEGTDETLVDDLVHNRVDLVVGRLFSGDSDQDLIRVHLYDEPIRIMVRTGHPALAADDASLTALASYPWIYPHASTGLIDQLHADFRREGAPLPLDVMECDSHLTTRAMVRATDALALVPFLVGADDDEFALLPTTLDTVTRQIGVTHLRETALTPALEMVIAELRAAADAVEIP